MNITRIWLRLGLQSWAQEGGWPPDPARFIHARVGRLPGVIVAT
jgi:hypothetical protein